MSRLAQAHDVLLFDLDGVVYIGEHAVPWAVQAICAAADEGVRSVFVTNNASRTPQQVAKHLRDLGLPAEEDDVVTSAMAGASLLRNWVPAGHVLAIGGDGVGWALRERGFSPVDAFDEQTAAVMQGYGPGVGWRQLAEATFAVRAGLPWVATNMDATFPTARGAAPGNGAMVRLVAETAGRGPDAVAGKPEPALIEEAVRRTGAVRPLIIGDRLDTDIAAGSRLGIPTLLVLTGIADLASARHAVGDQQPTYVADDLRCLMPDSAWPPNGPPSR